MSMKMSSTSISLLESGELTLVGRSRAGDGTSFVIPELKWIFDCGALVHGQEPSHIFLTHTHADHVTFLAYHFHKERNNSNNSKPPMIYVPNEALFFVQEYLKAHYCLIEMCTLDDIMMKNENNNNNNKNNKKNFDMSNIKAVQHGNDFIIKQRGGIEYTITPILTDHRIVCYGYNVCRTKKKLKSEYKNLPSTEIASIKKQGIIIYDYYKEPLFCYIGDSTHSVFELNKNILQQHNVIITECTFIHDDDLQKANETKHTHWNNLKPYVQQHPNVLFILIHFSLKYSAAYLWDFFQQQANDNNIHNVHPMIIEQEVMSEWKKKFKEKPPKCPCFRCSKNNNNTNNNNDNNDNNNNSKSHKRRNSMNDDLASSAKAKEGEVEEQQEQQQPQRLLRRSRSDRNSMKLMDRSGHNEEGIPISPRKGPDRRKGLMRTKSDRNSLRDLMNMATTKGEGGGNNNNNNDHDQKNQNNMKDQKNNNNNNNNQLNDTESSHITKEQQ